MKYKKEIAEIKSVIEAEKENMRDMGGYVYDEMPLKRLTDAESSIAVRYGIPIGFKSKYCDYHGSHKGDYSYSRVTDMSGYIHSKRENYTESTATISPDFNDPKLIKDCIDKLKDIETAIQAETGEMNKDTFWKIIESAKEGCGGDMSKMPQVLKNDLSVLQDESIKKFGEIMSEYINNSDKMGLWSAGLAMNKLGCSDDGFYYFRNWLVGQGKDTYMNALKNPDSLANADVKPVDGYYELEGMSYAAYSALDMRTGYDEYKEKLLTPEEKADILGEIQYDNNINCVFELIEMEAYIPKLCEKHLSDMELNYDKPLWNKSVFFYNQELSDVQKLDLMIEYIEKNTGGKYSVSTGMGDPSIYCNQTSPIGLRMIKHNSGDMVNLEFECSVEKFKATKTSDLNSFITELSKVKGVMSVLNNANITVSEDVFFNYNNEHSAEQEMGGMNMQ